ncbi:hypothetical protein OJ998_02500 [Solirubrobacter taibaiensis]|nr:hypothetical protein [Solirubrobacter taibaiensis]
MKRQLVVCAGWLVLYEVVAVLLDAAGAPWWTQIALPLAVVAGSQQYCRLLLPRRAHDRRGRRAPRRAGHRVGPLDRFPQTTFRAWLRVDELDARHRLSGQEPGRQHRSRWRDAGDLTTPLDRTVEQRASCRFGVVRVPTRLACAHDDPEHEDADDRRDQGRDRHRDDIADAKRHRPHDARTVAQLS